LELALGDHETGTSRAVLEALKYHCDRELSYESEQCHGAVDGAFGRRRLAFLLPATHTLRRMALQRRVLSEALAKARAEGLQESLRLGGEIVRARAARLSDNRRRVFVFLSPHLNNSGAPLILMRIVDEFASRYGRESVRLLAPPSIAEPHEHAEVGGVKVERAAKVLSPILVRLQLALRKDDFVLMNTAAVLRNYLEVVLDSVQTGSLSHAHWYIHESVDLLPVVAPFLLQSDTRSRIGGLMAQGQLTILVPSKKVKAEYDALFGNAQTRVLPFKMVADTHHMASLPADHYSSLRFLMSGKPTDGNKGHIVALAAFHEFMKAHHETDPDTYRPFTLTLVGMTDDYISQQILSTGSTVLGERLKAFSVVPHEKSLEITRGCNAVICCSFTETGPLYVIEGMSCGHIVLRNNAGGIEEQLDDGVNGFRIDSTDITQFAGVLARMLNKRTMADSRLHAMGRASQELVARLVIPSYVDALELAHDAKD
jgi:glycosyltransferase involved in cell wall biosynthesis